VCGQEEEWVLYDGALPSYDGAAQHLMATPPVDELLTAIRQLQGSINLTQYYGRVVLKYDGAYLS
jgi:hypothetical protein